MNDLNFDKNAYRIATSFPLYTEQTESQER